jgi:hypothetical protein
MDPDQGRQRSVVRPFGGSVVLRKPAPFGRSTLWTPQPANALSFHVGVHRRVSAVPLRSTEEIPGRTCLAGVVSPRRSLRTNIADRVPTECWVRLLHQPGCCGFRAAPRVLSPRPALADPRRLAPTPFLFGPYPKTRAVTGP